MEKHFDFHKAEREILEFWEKEKIYDYNFDSKKPKYKIDTPPPYVSGRLHLGHFANFTHMDIRARFKRMQGYEIFFPVGLDNNGHPTEILMEKTKGVTKKDVPLEKYIELCLETSRELEPNYINDLREWGISFNRNVFYTTIDEESQRCAQQSFIELYKMNRIYRKKDIVIFCPKCQTVLAQADVEDEVFKTYLVYVKFKIKETNEDLIIATTRPELLCAVVAVFVNPEDERYKEIVGKTAVVPIYNKEVPILTDEKVDPNFGTGAVMVATFGDKTDIEWVKEYNLPIVEAISKEGTLTDVAGPIKGLSIEEGRKKIIEILEKEGLIVKKEELEHTVGVCWRCKTPIEFILTEQWFLKLLDLKEKLIEQGRKIRWIPEHFRIRYEHWIESLKWDWVISRQRYYGIPIPVWYAKKKDGSIEIILPDEKDLPVDPRFQEPPKDKIPEDTVEIIPEKDVLDTWFTSSLTPMIATKDWRKDEKQFRELFPFDLRPQSHDIIRTWAFYTIVKALLHENDIPWKDICITGFIFGTDAKKMSKSRGNEVTPKEVIEKYGTDAIRYWTVCVKMGEDNLVKYQDYERGKSFVDKLWNIVRFFVSYLPEDFKPEEFITSTYSDELIFNKLNDVKEKVTKYYEEYEFSLARKELELFVFEDISSYYIEILKKRIKEYDNSAFINLYIILRDTIKMLAPIMPFVTEKLWQEVFRKYEEEISVHISSWPKIEKYDAKKVQEWEKLKEIISNIRKAKTEKGISLGKEISKVEISAPKDYIEIINKVIEEIKNTVKANEIIIKEAEELKIVVIP